MSLLRPQQEKPPKQSLGQRIVGGIKRGVNGLQKFSENALNKSIIGAGARSIETRSWKPLAEFGKEAGNRFSKEFVASKNDTPEEIARKSLNAVLSFSGGSDNIKIKKPGIISEIKSQIKPAINRVEREGAAGKELASKITKAADVGEVNAGKRLSRLRQAPKLNRTESFNLQDVLEGRAEPQNINVEKAAKVARRELDDIVNEAVGNIEVKRKVVLKPSASSVISYIDKDGRKVYTDLTPEELNVLKDEVKNIPKAREGTSQIHLDAKTPQLLENGTKVSRTDFLKDHPDAAEVLRKAERPGELPGDSHTKGLTNLQREALAAGKEIKATIKTPFQKLENFYPHVIPGEEALAKGAVRNDVAENLVRLGVKKTLKEAEQFIDDYRNFIQSGQRVDSLLQYMTKTGQAKNEAEALANLQHFRDRTIKRQGSLEFSRQVDLPFYDPNPGRVLPQYLASTSKRLAEIKQFGQNNEAVNKLINDIRKNGGNADAVRHTVDRILGIVNSTPPLKRLGVFLRALQGFKLGLASIPNATQGVLNSMLKGDLRAVGAGLKGLLTKDGRLFALESGAVLESTLKESVKESGALSVFLKATGFTATEKANRIIAANAGKSFGTRLFKKALKGNTRAVATLKELGVDVTGKTALTGDDVLMMAKKFTDITQFRSRPQDLPLFASSESGKIFFQFKNFIYGQTRLIYNTTIGEFRAGNFGRGTRNLMVLGTLFPLAGEVIADIRAFITGKKREPKGLARYFDDIAQTGAMGILYDSIKSAGLQKGTEYIVGPTVADAGELLNAFGAQKTKTKNAPQKKGEALGKFVLKRIPIFGNRLSSAAFPTKTTKKKTSRLRR